MERSFRAMGTEVTLLAHDAPARTFGPALAAVVAIFEQEEQRFSRFRHDSELSRLNRLIGTWVEATAPFLEVVRLALEGAEATHGLFDPTVLRALEAAGYDRTFVEIEEQSGVHHEPIPCGRWREIEVRDDHIRIPEGVGLDLGGLVKGWTADLAAEAVVASGLDWAVVNAGGDLRIAGDRPPLEIGIQEPGCAEEVACTVRVGGGALATTSVTQRRWGPDLHHVIDPRIGLPARTPVLQATIWDETCATAEIASKRALLEGVAALDELSGVLILTSGEIVMNLASEAA